MIHPQLSRLGVSSGAEAFANSIASGVEGVFVSSIPDDSDVRLTPL